MQLFRRDHVEVSHIRMVILTRHISVTPARWFWLQFHVCSINRNLPLPPPKKRERKRKKKDKEKKNKVETSHFQLDSLPKQIFFSWILCQNSLSRTLKVKWSECKNTTNMSNNSILLTCVLKFVLI